MTAVDVPRAAVAPPAPGADAAAWQERHDAIAAVYEMRRGEWLAAGDVAEAAGVPRGSLAPFLDRLVSAGRLEHNGKGRAHSRYRAPETAAVAATEEGAGDEDPEPEPLLVDQLAGFVDDADPRAHAAAVPARASVDALGERLRGQILGLLAREWPLKSGSVARRLVLNAREVGEAMSAMSREGILERGASGGYQLVDRHAHTGTVS